MSVYRRVEVHNAGPGIKSLESLREHLQTALAVEQSTLPPYLTAMYSIQGTANMEAMLMLRRVATEEMLHMLLVGNLLVALGGEPSLTKPGFTLRYPSRLPDAAPNIELGLTRFSRESVRSFMRVEQPERPDSKPEADDFHSIGQFYRAIANALVDPPVQQEIEAWWRKHPVVDTLPRQVGPSEFYGSGGQSMFVTDIASALDALHEIVHQGEGLVEKSGNDKVGGGEADFGEPWQPAHYYQFEQLLIGRAYQKGDVSGAPTGPLVPVDWEAVSPVRPNPRVAEFRKAGSLAVPMMETFNFRYAELLAHIEARFRGEIGSFYMLVATMMQIKNIAKDLMNIPSGFGDGTTAGPSYEVDEMRHA